MEEIKKAGVMNPQPNHNWKFIPETWTIPAAARDRKTSFWRINKSEGKVTKEQ